MPNVTLIVAAPGQGKTEKMVKMFKGKKAVIFVPTANNKNQLLVEIPFTWADKYIDGEAGVRQAKADQVRLVLQAGEASEVFAYFMDPEWADWSFGFDDFPQLLDDYDDLKAFKRFVAGSRHRDAQIVVTSQRLQGQIPPYVRSCSDVIYQMGPVYAREEAKALYSLSSGKDRTFEEFYDRISVVERYAVFPVRDLELSAPPAKTKEEA